MKQEKIPVSIHMSHTGLPGSIKTILPTYAGFAKFAPGYLLPIVIALGLAISLISITALGVISQNGTTLSAQYYNELAAEAAKAGITAAITCIDNGAMDWDTGGNAKLQPQTDCHGTTVSGKSTTVYNDSVMQSTYTVSALQNPYSDSNRAITSTGTVTLMANGGLKVGAYTKVVRTLGQLAPPAVNDFKRISTSALHTCAINDKAYCWGGNTSGELGDGTTTSSTAPIAVDTSGVLSGKTVTDISTGYLHTCAVADGKAYCWGDNSYGQLGNNTTTSSKVPVAVYTSGVLGGKTVTAISTGAYYTCAVADGKAYCWGTNGYGQLGNNTTTTYAYPVAVYSSGVLSGKTVTVISTNTYHTCAVASGKAYCWGYNAYGELGNNSTTSYAYPVAVYTSGVLSGKTVTAIYSGYFHNCATASGNAYCWGYNGYGQLGNNSTNSYSYPVAVYTGGALSGKTITAISAGSYHSCASADGQAYCWGYNAYGELGNNSTTSSITPVAVYSGDVLSGKTVTLISADLGYTCASASDEAFCWGLNTYGNLGNGTKTDSHVPVSVLAPDLPPGSVSSSSYTFINPVFF